MLPSKAGDLLFISGRCAKILKRAYCRALPFQKSQKEKRKKKHNTESFVEAPQCPERFITGRFVPHSEI